MIQNQYVSSEEEILCQTTRRYCRRIGCLSSREGRRRRVALELFVEHWRWPKFVPVRPGIGTVNGWSPRTSSVISRKSLPFPWIPCLRARGLLCSIPHLVFNLQLRCRILLRPTFTTRCACLLVHRPSSSTRSCSPASHIRSTPTSQPAYQSKCWEFFTPKQGEPLYSRFRRNR